VNVDLTDDETLIAKGSPGYDVLGLLVKQQEQQIRIGELHAQYRDLLSEHSTVENQVTATIGPSGGSSVRQLRLLQKALAGEVDGMLESLRSLSSTSGKSVEEATYRAITLGVLRVPNIATFVLPEFLGSSGSHKECPAFLECQRVLVSTKAHKDEIKAQAIVGSDSLSLHAIRTSRSTASLNLIVPKLDGSAMRVMSPLLPSVVTSFPADVVPKVCDTVKMWWCERGYRQRLPLQCNEALVLLSASPAFGSFQVHSTSNANPNAWRCLAASLLRKRLNHAEMSPVLWCVQTNLERFTGASHAELIRIICEDVIPRLALPLDAAEYAKKSIDMTGWKGCICGTTNAITTQLRAGGASIASYLPAMFQWCTLFWPFFGESMLKRITRPPKGQKEAASLGAITCKTLTTTCGNVALHDRIMRVVPTLPHDTLIIDIVQEGVIGVICSTTVRQWLTTPSISSFLKDLGAWAKRVKPKIKGPAKKHLKQVTAILKGDPSQIDPSLVAFIQSF
jgi:hypothetical protein